MLATAVRDGLVSANVAAQVERPQTDTAEAEYLTAERLREVLTGVREARIYPVILLLASTGARIAEALGLRWDDVDLDTGTLRVTGTLSGYGTQAGGRHLQ